MKFLHSRGKAGIRLYSGFPCNQFGAQEPGSAEEVIFSSSSDRLQLFNLADCSPCVQWVWCRVQNDGEGGREGIQCAPCLAIPNRWSSLRLKYQLVTKVSLLSMHSSVSLGSQVLLIHVPAVVNLCKELLSELMMYFFWLSCCTLSQNL